MKIIDGKIVERGSNVVWHEFGIFCIDKVEL